MIQKIDHLGIAVRSLDETVLYYEQALGLKCSGKEEAPSQKVKIAFFQVGDVRLELLEPTSVDSAVAQFLEKHGEGVHHVAFATDSIDEQLSMAKNAGCRLIHETPIKGAGGRQVAFLHPKSTYGVLTEFCSIEIKQKNHV
ncbi:MAG: methylmalonyl-CoA epimerase [Candidatus Brocadiaceae bacterium]|nr:methylmalonyl-CoA epimerase [Candidatus Brocadiaceae bacterium]